jgi:hypothetical protein
MSKWKECKYNCKEEGPPGPLWCTECGHAPSCCNCEYDPREQQEPKPDLTITQCREEVIE